jgi:hypothetical protein
MNSKVQKVGWIGQAVIVSVGSVIGALLALELAPIVVSLHGVEPGQQAIWMWCIASCGAIAGGLLFSWVKGSMTSRNSTAAPILAALAIVLLPLLAYLGGYFWLGAREDYYTGRFGFPGDAPPDPKLVLIERTYQQEWLKTIYLPAGKVETWARGIDVDVVWRGETIIRNIF